MKIEVDEKQLELLKKESPILTTKQMASYMGYKSDDALRKQRSSSSSIFPYFKIGNRVFYPLAKTLELAEKKLVKV